MVAAKWVGSKGVKAHCLVQLTMLLISTPVSAKPEIRGAIFLAYFMHAVRFLRMGKSYAERTFAHEPANQLATSAMGA